MQFRCCPGDWKAELLHMTSLVSMEGAPRSNYVNVTRDRVMECARRAFNRKTFMPLQKLSVSFVDAADVSEGAVDNGGLTREFFSILLKEALTSQIFEGPIDVRQLALSTQDLANGTYRDIGKFFALSLLHGGPGPKCLSKALYDQISEKANRTRPSLTDVHDENVQVCLKKIKDAVTLDEARDQLTKRRDLLAVLGCIRHVRSLADRDKLVQDAVEFYLFGRLQLALDQFMEGLKTGGLLKAIQSNPDGFQHLFVWEGGNELVSLTIQHLFIPTLSPAGSNKRNVENIILSFWRDWLIDVADGESLVSLKQVLSFSTGAEDIPPLGFADQPSIEFLHDGGIYPTSNTCSLIFRLPVDTQYDKWKANMESGIIQAPTFGVS